MSEVDGQQPPDTGGATGQRDDTTPFSSVQRTPQTRPPAGDPSVQNLFGNPNYHAQTPSAASHQELQRNLADARTRDFLARKRKSREAQLERHLGDRNLSIFSNDDKVTIMAHANALGADAVDYLQQCEEHIRILLQGDESDLDMLNTVEKMLSELPEPRKTARGSMDFSSEAVARVGTQFLTMVEDITTLGIDLEEDLVALQDSLQALYVKNISTLEGAAIKENWASAELNKLKGQVKEAHSRANSIIKQAKKDKMKRLAKSKIDRRENRVYNLIENVDETVSRKVNSEETCVFVESIGNLLNEEARDLDTSIDDLIVLDPQLGDRAERLRCAASASAMKALNTARKYRNEDGASKCSASSFAPRTKTTTAGAAGDKMTSAASLHRYE